MRRWLSWSMALVAGCTVARPQHQGSAPEAALRTPVAIPAKMRAAPASVASGRAGREPGRHPADVGLRIARRAARLVGLKHLSQVSRRVPDDCTGLARLSAEPEGVALLDGGARGEGGVVAMFRRARQRGAVHKGPPRPGDLVFFRDTYDRNRDGRRDDGLTHVGVVESVREDGTVTFVHRGSRGVARARLNLDAPHDLGRNDFLRRRSPRARAYLAGELFAAYASPDRL